MDAAPGAIQGRRTGMKDKDKEATDKLNKWLSDIGLSEECNKDYCNIETKDNELTELIKEQHRNE